MNKTNLLPKILRYAALYRRLGMYPIPVPLGRKSPCIDDWQTLRLAEEEIPVVFAEPCNLAILMGIDGLTDVDADRQSAVRAAKFFLPETEWVFGHLSKEDSHYIYRLNRAIPTIQLQDPVKHKTREEQMIVELRCTKQDGKVGLCTVFPPSIHERGEEIKFAAGKKATAPPPLVETEELVIAVYRIGAAALLADHWVASGAGRHKCMLALAGTLAHSRWSEAEAFKFCNAVYRSLADPDQKQFERVGSEVSSTFENHRDGQKITGAKTLRSFLTAEVVNAALSWLGIAHMTAEETLAAAEEHTTPTDNADEKTVIEIAGKEQEAITEETLQALYIFNNPPKLFTRLQSIVSMSSDKKKNVAIKEVGVTDLKHHLYRAARYTLGNTVAKIPFEVLQDILALPTGALQFPELEGIIRGPVMRHDGSIIDVPGYDAATGLLYIEDPSLSVPGIPGMPTREDAHAAVKVLLHYMREFPFPDAASRANATAAMITPIVRPVIDGVVPLAIISAVSPASGKTTHADLISIAASGLYGGYMGAPTNPEEWSKRITSALRKGAPVIVIDNVKDTQPLDSPDLCRLITDREWADRELQHSREIRIPNRALWIATGNNLKLGGDMGTRCFLIKLDAGPDPSRRKFSTDRPHDYWKRERGKMLAAILTLARAWFVAGCPPPKDTPQTRFAEWVRVVGGMLEHAGISGFLDNYEELRANADRESAEWEAFHRTVRGLFSGEFQVRHLILKLESNPDTKDALPRSLRSLASNYDKLATALGNEYSARENRPYGSDGIKVIRLGTGHGGAMKYRIVTSQEGLR